MALPIGVNNYIQKIRQTALFSRLSIFVVQLFFNTIIPDHDACIFDPPELENSTFTDMIVHKYFSGLVRWDGVYFTHIAQYGYTYENCLAFFPLFPLALRATATILFLPLRYVINFKSCIILSSFFINQWLFLQTAECLFYLGVKVLSSKSIAYRAALLFCFNPASIFMSAPYTEVLFLYLTTKGLTYVHSNSSIKAALFFGLGSLTRSNGILNLGFIVHSELRGFIPKMTSFINNIFNKSYTVLPVSLAAFLFLLTSTFVASIITIGPFLAYQVYSYNTFCQIKTAQNDIPEKLIQYGNQQGYAVRGNSFSSTWCYDEIPLAYSYIQKHHWNLGVFNYYEVKQIPNFLLATPVSLLALASLWHYYKNNTHTCWTLGLASQNTKSFSGANAPFNWILMPYMAHLLFLVVFGWLYMHIQVITRLLFSCSPILYWYAAYFITTDARTKVSKCNAVGTETLANVEQHSVETYRNVLVDQIISIKEQPKVSQCIICYFVIYFFVGTVLFSNNLPWT